MALALAGLLLAAPVAAAVEFVLPDTARLQAEETSVAGSHALPVAAWDGAGVPSITAEGRVTRQAWRLPGPGRTTLQIIAPLREQLRAAGFEIVFECRDTACGGFDFRHAIEVLPAPAMHVDLSRYRVLSAIRATEGDAADFVSLLASRSPSGGFLQIVHVASGTDGRLQASGGPAAAPVGPGTPLGEALERAGHAVLDDLAFESGAIALGPGPFASLAALAAYLRQNPDARVVLVGHTDAVGDLDANIGLSRRRAEAVRTRLVETYGVDPARLGAEGTGYLAPRASNLAAEGREANRRVEAVLLTTR